MADANTLKLKQRGVALRMGAVICVTFLVSAMCLYWGAKANTTMTERLVIVVKADVFVVCWLAAAIGNVARLRFFSAEDIAGSGSGTATAKVARANAILQNTLEQVAIAVPVHVALAVLVASSIQLIIAFAALFAIGRFLFWNGYARGAEGRALGFGLTFYPSVVGLGIASIASVRLLP